MIYDKPFKPLGSFLFMGKEIEKKYLLRENGESYTNNSVIILSSSLDCLISETKVRGKEIRQGYLSSHLGKDISKMLGLRVRFDPVEARLRDKAGSFYFTLKGPGNLSRNEIESRLPESIFQRFWPRTMGRRVFKIRHQRPYLGHVAEIDVYTDRDLVLAEIEVPSESAAEKLYPLGKDVTYDSAYKNKNLAM